MGCHYIVKENNGSDTQYSIEIYGENICCWKYNHNTTPRRTEYVGDKNNDIVKNIFMKILYTNEIETITINNDKIKEFKNKAKEVRQQKKEGESVGIISHSINK